MGEKPASSPKFADDKSKQSQVKQEDVTSAAAALAGILKDKSSPNESQKPSEIKNEKSDNKEDKVKKSDTSKLKKVESDKPKPIKLTDFSIKLGMKFSMQDVHYEIDSHSRTRTDEFVKCIQQNNKMNEEYPKRIYLDKEQL